MICHIRVWTAAMVLLLPFVSVSLSQSGAPIVHQFPRPNAIEVSSATDIGIRIDGTFDRASIQNSEFSAKGTLSGDHLLNVKLSADRRSLILHPHTPFLNGERIQVNVATRSEKGIAVSTAFSFTTAKRSPTAHYDTEANILQPISNSKIAVEAVTSEEDSLPPMKVTVDTRPTPGLTYIANIGFKPVSNQCFLFALDEHGSIVRKQLLPNDHALDFKIQPNGLRTYFDAVAGKFYGMDSTWTIVDSFEVVHGYPPDGHDLHIFPDGSYALLGQTESVMDMHQYFQAGYDTASITGNVIQIFDADKNNIFEWRGIDYFNPLDAIHENLTAEFIDFEHANSLEFDPQGNIILSNRHLCEITKINGQTGDIMWRFGGAHNQFRLIGDSIWFSYQHAVRLLPNGHLIFYDNSNFDTVIGRSSDTIRHSRAVEYELDTTAMTAKLVWQYHHSPETYGMALGYVERLPNQNTLICWGADSIVITELAPDNSTVFEMMMGAGNYTYRAIKYPTASAGVEPAEKLGQNLSLDVAEVSGNTIRVDCQLPASQAVTLTECDILGRHVSTLIAQIYLRAGSYSFQQQLPQTAPGPYFLILQGEQGKVIRRFTR